MLSPYGDNPPRLQKGNDKGNHDPYGFDGSLAYPLISQEELAKINADGGDGGDPMKFFPNGLPLSQGFQPDPQRDLANEADELWLMRNQY